MKGHSPLSTNAVSEFYVIYVGFSSKLKDSAFEGSYISEGINEMKDFVAITELNSV